MKKLQKPSTDLLMTEGLPQALESEKVILASILKRSVDFWEVRSSLSADDFSVEQHRVIWKRLEIMAQSGGGIDAVSVAENLHRSGERDAAGGFSYLIDLDRNMPALAAIDQHIKTVRDKSILRKTIAVAENIRSKAILEEGSPTELLGNAERMLVDLGMEVSSAATFKTPGEVIRSRGGLDSYLKRGRELGVTSGYPYLDRMTCGLRKKQLWVLAASTGCGKSTFARNFSLNAGLKGHAGAFITLEMGEDEVTDGFICAAGQINTQIIRRGYMHDRTSLSGAANSVADLPIYIRDKAGCTVAELHGELRKLKAEKGIEYAIIDYLQLMNPGGKFENTNAEIANMTRGLKLLAMDLDIGVMVLSQFKRLRGLKPTLDDLRDSGTIENNANTIIFLYSERQELKMDTYPTEVIVAKQRGGEVGTLNFGFRKATGTFVEYEQQGQEAAA